MIRRRLPLVGMLLIAACDAPSPVKQRQGPAPTPSATAATAKAPAWLLGDWALVEGRACWADLLEIAPAALTYRPYGGEELKSFPVSFRAGPPPEVAMIDPNGQARRFVPTADGGIEAINDLGQRDCRYQRTD